MKGKAVASSEKQKRQAWSIEEEKLLTKGWLHIQTTLLSGTPKRTMTFGIRSTHTLKMVAMW